MDFVIIANQWDAHKHNPTSKHHVAKELVRTGHRVLWVVGSGMRTPSVASSSDRGRIWGKIRGALSGITKQVKEGDLFTINPLILPFPESALVRCLNSMIYLISISAATRRLGFKNKVLINFLPTIPGVHKRWEGKSIYYCVDKWSAFDNYDTNLMEQLDSDCCRNANVVIASARDLEQRCLKYNGNTHLILHGVDYDNFSTAASSDLSRPLDFPKGKTVGFFGLISGWVDQDLLIKLARELNDVSIVLIGQADVDVSRLETEENIYLLGRRDYKELSRYLAHFDVGVIPFLVNDLTLAVNPIKLREMLAGGCRVVSTNLPEVSLLTRSVDGNEKDDSGVWVADNHDEFVDIVRTLLEKSLSDEERKTLSATMVSETWKDKVEFIIDLLA